MLLGILLLTTAGAAQSLTVSPSFLTVRYQQGGSLPAAQNVTVTSSSGSLTFAVEVASNPSDWLDVTPRSGTTPSVLNALVRPAGLTPGEYRAVITITAPGGFLSTRTVSVTLSVSPPALSLTATPSTLSFSHVIGGPSPPSQTVAVSSNRTDVSFTVSSSVYWLKVTPEKGSVPATLSVSLEPSQASLLRAGSYSGSIRVTAVSVATFEAVSASVVVNLNLNAGEPPPALTAVVNAASFLAGPVAPGEIVTVFGSRLGPATLTTARLNTAGLVDSSLAGTRLLFDGVPAPMVYTSQSQASAVVPYGVANRRTTVVQAEYQGRKSESLSLPVAPADPAIFTLGSTGRGQGAILNQDGSPNSSLIPAEPGSVVVLFATGEGQTIPAGVDGRPAAEPLPRPIQPVSARIDGIPAQVAYAGAAPGLVAGVLQINVALPDGVGPGDVPVVLKVGDAYSPPGVTLAARGGHGPVAANLSMSFSPNPVSRSPDGFWYFRISLTETRGVGVNLSRLIVNGSDWTPFMSSVFSTSRIPAASSVSADVRAPCGVPCPQSAFDTLWEIFGSDENGHPDLRWTALLRLIP